MFCYSNNGMSMRTVYDSYVAQAGEVLFANYATAEQLTVIFSDYVNAILVETKSTKLAEIKVKLAETDYKCLKFVDGSLDAAEYATTKAEREALRVAYNTIESATTLEAVNSVSY